ncbi:hypothetical protein QZH47_11290 [Pseudomonas corrugata]
MLFFIIEGRPVVVFGSRDPLPLFFAIPIRDQEQTYFLSADLLFRHAIQPIRVLPEGSLIVLCPVAGCSWKHPEKPIFSKKSVSCVSAVLFLLCQSRFVLFLLGLPLFYSCYAREIAGVVPTFKKPYKSMC